jgi:hypothetical protein
MSNDVTLENGWAMALEAVRVPMTLVKFTRGSEVQRARFDVDKRSFIDTIPAEVSTDKREALVRSVLAMPLHADR